MLTTTLNQLKKHGACTDRYKVLLKALGGAKKYGYDKPITMLFILESNGLDDCMWAMRAVEPGQEAERDRICRLFACGEAERVLPIYEKAYPGDRSVRDCISVARRFADGEATPEELAAARDVARAAARAVAWDAARAAAWAAAWDAAGDVAWAAACDARDAAWAVAGDVAWAAAWDALKQLLSGE